MASLKVNIINQALTRTGNNVIATESDTTTEAVVMLANYEQLVSHELSHPWNFAKRWAALNLNSETPLSTFTYSWRLPSDVLTVRRIGLLNSKVPVDFERDEQNIYCDQQQNVVALYSYRPSEELWPPYFVEVIVQALIVVCCRGLNESRTTAADAKMELERTRLIARNTDAQQRSGRDVISSPLVEAHRG